MSEIQPEKRRFSRVDFNTKTAISNNSRHWETQLIDISLNGVLVERPEGWEGKIGDECKVDVLLSEYEVAIQMSASIAHIQENCIGFRCEHIDFDSITHLRRLIELNLGDVEQVNRELSQMIAQA